jgi:hypothetical protein
MQGKVSGQKPDILETSEFFWEEINLFQGAVKCARFWSSSLECIEKYNVDNFCIPSRDQ